MWRSEGGKPSKHARGGPPQGPGGPESRETRSREPDCTGHWPKRSHFRKSRSPPAPSFERDDRCGDKIPPQNLTGGTFREFSGHGRSITFSVIPKSLGFPDSWLKPSHGSHFPGFHPPGPLLFAENRLPSPGWFHFLAFSLQAAPRTPGTTPERRGVTS